MRLPKLPNQIRHYKRDVLQFGGLNVTPDIRDGEFTRTQGITTANYPYITQVPEFETLNYYNGNGFSTYVDPVDMYEWNGNLYVIQADGGVYIGGTHLGNIEASASGRSMAVINTRLVIFPDKYYIDLTDNSIHSLIKKSWNGTASISEGTDDATLTGTGVGADFAVNDVVDIVINNGVDDEIIARVLTVTEVGTDYIKVTLTDELKTLIIAFLSRLTTDDFIVRSSVPDLSVICASGNRIWGCCERNNTIYASALGDPTDFFTYGNDTGAYTVAVGSDGYFTAICEYNNSVLCWKQDILHKILGNYPSEYYMTTSSLDGVLGGSPNSLVEINGLLYYLGPRGVYVYGGNRPRLISEKLGKNTPAFGDANGHYMDGACGSDGRFLYFSCFVGNAGTYSKERLDLWPGGTHLFVYDLDRGLWVCEQDRFWASRIIGSTMLKWDDVYEEGTNKIVQRKSEISDDQPWSVEFAEVVEDTFSRKGYTRLNVRLDMQPGSDAVIYAKEDRRKYREIWSGSRPKKNYYMPVAHVNFANPETVMCTNYTTPLSDEKAFVYLDGTTVEGTWAYDDGADGPTFEGEFPSEGLKLRLVFSYQTLEGTVTAYDLTTGEQVETDEWHYVAFWKSKADYNPVTALVPIRLGRCDRYQIKIEGTGEVTIRGIEREYVTGSEK